MNTASIIHDDLTALRAQVSLISLKVLVGVGALVVAWSFVQDQPYRYVHLGAEFLLIGVIYFQKKLPDVGAYVLFCVFYFVGVTELLDDGFDGAHIECFVLGTFLVSALIGARGAIVSIAICLFTISSVAFLLQNGWLQLQPESDGLPENWTGWVWDHLSLLLFAGAISGATVYLMDRLNRSLNHANSLVRRLEQEVEEKGNAIQMSLESEQMYQLLADNVSDVVFTLTLDLKTIYCSPSVLQQRGYTAEEVLELDVLSSISPETRHVVTTTLEQAFKDMEAGIDRVYPLEYEISHKNGHYVWIETRVTIVHGSDGNDACLLGVSRDITERKRAEQANRELETQIRHIQRIESVGQLAGGIAHDFNNILVAIMGYTELSLNSQLNEEVRQNLQGVMSSALRASKLTGQLLAFSRRQMFNLQSINLNELVLKLEGMLGRLIREDIDLTITTTNEDNYIDGDSGQLEQVIVNLVVNARDSMPDGGQLNIILDRVGPDDEFIHQQSNHLDVNYSRLVVRDYGIGIPTDKIELLFEPFFTTKLEGTGTGLGLSVVYGIVTQHRGYVTAYQREDGTDFVVYLPEATERVQASPHPKSRVLSHRGTETILIVEDDEPVRAVVSRMLEGAGYHLLLAKDGLDALRLFDQHRKDIGLILMDVVMPKMNGKDVMLKIRETDTTVPFLFSSGYFYDAQQSDFINEYDLELLKKPYKQEALLERVRRILDSGVEVSAAD